MRRDPTHGRIDPDIQVRVDALEPQTIGQRVAMENNMQRRRDELGCLDGTTSCSPDRHTYTWPCSHAVLAELPRARRAGRRMGRWASLLHYLVFRHFCFECDKPTILEHRHLVLRNGGPRA